MTYPTFSPLVPGSQRWLRGALATVLATLMAMAAAPVAAQNVANGKILFEQTKFCIGCHFNFPAENTNNVANGANDPQRILDACNRNVPDMTSTCASSLEGGPFEGFAALSRAEAIDIAAYLGDPNGQQAILSVSSQTLAFRRQVNNGTSPIQNITVINTGNGSATLTFVGLSGTDAANFALVAPSIADTPCVAGQLLPPFTSCSTGVTFTPGNQQAQRSAQLTLVPDDSSLPSLLVNIAGVATQNKESLLTAGVAQLNFGSTTINSAAAAKSLTVTNNGDADLVFDNADAFALGGEGAAEFTLNPGSTCTAGGQVASNGGTCSVVLNFTPLSTGARTATITLKSNAADDGSVFLAGFGFSPSSNLGAAGCTVGDPNAPLDPTLMVLSLLALAVLAWRARSSSSSSKSSS